MLWSWERARAPGGGSSQLFPAAPALRAALHVSLAALGVAHVGIVFHSLRAGGALFLLNCKIELGVVPGVGRKARDRTCSDCAPWPRVARMPPGLLARGAVFAAEPRQLLAPWFE